MTRQTIGSRKTKTPLDDQPFRWQAAGEDRIQIFWEGRVVTTVSGKAGLKLKHKLEQADELETQHLLARATGNFRRGNERG